MIDDIGHYGLIILFASAVGLVAVMANRLTERVKIPAPLLVLAGAALATAVIPPLSAPPESTHPRR